MSLAESGILERNGVELIGAKLRAIRKAENRELFSDAMKKLGLEMAKGFFVRNEKEAREALEEIGLPIIIRPSFTLGGTGGGFAETKAEYYDAVRHGLAESPIGEVLVEECLFGWKEYELEVIRDLADNVIIVCSIENVDPMGVHTGDSITVAPAQTLSDRQYQELRDASVRIIREIGVETGGSNIQFAINPENGRIVIIEMNPRVSRSSALASKATGFPIAKVAAKLAVGYTLDEILNDITKSTPASFEPAIDYCVVKVPRWDFEKFKNVDARLGVQMKSVGEVMAFGRNFREALQKSLRGLEIGRAGLGADGKDLMNVVDMTPEQKRFAKEDILEKIKVPKADRMFYIRYAFQAGQRLRKFFRQLPSTAGFLTISVRLLCVRTGCASLPWRSEKETMKYLSAILEEKRREVEALKRQNPSARYRDVASSLPSCRGFARALQGEGGSIRLIAEVKKASPQEGSSLRILILSALRLPMRLWGLLLFPC